MPPVIEQEMKTGSKRLRRRLDVMGDAPGVSRRSHRS
jgi:hypothetical protein